MKMLSLVPFLAFMGWAASSPTPAEFAIQNAQSEIAQHPDYAGSYNRLAMAYAAAREKRTTLRFTRKRKRRWQNRWSFLPRTTMREKRAW